MREALTSLTACLWVFLFLHASPSAWSQESIESQLAPPLPEAAEQPETPKLPVETIDPSPHLPGLPGWIVLLGISVILLILALIVFLVARNSPLSAPNLGRNYLHEAREALLNLRGLPAETPLAEISTLISLTLRTYLSRTNSDSALYQTREEFLTDEERLKHVPEPAKSETADFLSELSSLQYAPPSHAPKQVDSLIEKSLTILDLLAQPEPNSSPADD